jgi:hypothetical protein
MASNQLSKFQTEMNKIKTSNMQDKDKLHSMISLLEDYEEIFERVNYLYLLEECRDSIKVLKGTYKVYNMMPILLLFILLVLYFVV